MQFAFYQRIITSSSEIVWLRELRFAFSGNVISLKWDERFAALNVEAFVIDSIQSNGFAQFGYDS